MGRSVRDNGFLPPEIYIKIKLTLQQEHFDNYVLCNYDIFPDIQRIYCNHHKVYLF